MKENKQNDGVPPEESGDSAAANLGPAAQPAYDWAKNLPPGFMPITRGQIRAEKSIGHGTITDGNLYVPGVTATEWQKVVGGMLRRVHGGDDKSKGQIALVAADPLDLTAIPVTGLVTEGITIAIGTFLSRLGFKLPAGTKGEVPVELVGAALVITVSTPDPKPQREVGPRKKPGADGTAKK